MAELLTVGSPAPSCAGQSADESTVTLENYRGRWLVLYFYPKAHTSGCTLEGQEFNALLDEFDNLNAAVIGVSTDKPGTLAKFRDKHGFRFTLVSDDAKGIATDFGTLKEHGKSSERVTYLIDPDGIIQAVWPKVKVAGHAESVLARLRELAGERGG
ncbi:MAG: peroxiredoxin [Anaerolineae bacterium]|jgi:peroxiredoxin Q/BCP